MISHNNFFCKRKARTDYSVTGFFLKRQIVRPIIAVTKSRMLIHCEVDSPKRKPRISSPLKNSSVKRATG